MRAEQPTKLCKSRRKMRLRLGTRKTGLTPSSVIISGRLKAALSLRPHLSFYDVVCSL